MLKEIVDETSLGKYDFMYLRIGEFSVKGFFFFLFSVFPQFATNALFLSDFANNCKSVVSFFQLICQHFLTEPNNIQRWLRFH